MSKPTILDTIYSRRAQDVELAKQTPGTTSKDISRLLSMHLAPPLVSFVDRLRRNPSNPTARTTSEITSPSLMAEIKRASPSKGPIALDTPVAEQAITYALAGASVISVLTEPHWFKGSIHDMLMARQSVSSMPNRPAILRKEFILDEYQIAEARLYGADTVLLIVAMLDDEKLTRLYKYSLSLGMEPLVEVNNADEMRRALNLNAKVIGVNNRDLRSFNVDMGTTTRLVDMTKGHDVILCALSGISTPQDVRTYKEQGVKAILVGESLMRAKNTAAFIRALLDWPEINPIEPLRSLIVKASGVATPEQAQKLFKAGARMLGIVFDPTLAHSITLDQAKSIRNAFPRSSKTTTIAVPEQRTSSWFHSYLSTLAAQLTDECPLLVGHFTAHPSHTLSFILEAISSVSLDFVQFDGPVPADWARFIPVPVIRRFASPSSSGPDREDHTNVGVTVKVIRGINDASQITRPGLHSFSLVDLTVTSGSNIIMIPSLNDPAPVIQPISTFNLTAKGQRALAVNQSTISSSIAAVKEIARADEIGGRRSTPVMVTSGRAKLKLELIREIGAWGVDVELDDEEEDETYIQGLMKVN